MRAAIEAFGDRGGDIVNIASLAGLGPAPGYSVYAATKAAIVSISMSADSETPRSVRVHALCPDGVQTAMLDGQTPDSLGARLVHSGGRILTVDEVAREAVDLVGSTRVVLTRAALARRPDARRLGRSVGRQARPAAVRGAGQAPDREAEPLTSGGLRNARTFVRRGS